MYTQSHFHIIDPCGIYGRSINKLVWLLEFYFEISFREDTFHDCTLNNRWEVWTAWTLSLQHKSIIRNSMTRRTGSERDVQPNPINSEKNLWWIVEPEEPTRPPSIIICHQSSNKFDLNLNLSLWYDFTAIDKWIITHNMKPLFIYCPIVSMPWKMDSMLWMF